MTDDTLLPFHLPAVQRKNICALPPSAAIVTAVLTGPAGRRGTTRMSFMPPQPSRVVSCHDSRGTLLRMTMAANTRGDEGRNSFCLGGKRGCVAAAIRDPARQLAMLPMPGYFPPGRRPRLRQVPMPAQISSPRHETAFRRHAPPNRAAPLKTAASGLTTGPLLLPGPRRDRSRRDGRRAAAVRRDTEHPHRTGFGDGAQVGCCSGCHAKPSPSTGTGTSEVLVAPRQSALSGNEM